MIMTKKMLDDFSMGNIQISENVVEIIAGLTISEIEGVTTANRNLLDKGVTKFLNKRSHYTNGIKVEIGGNEARINIYILVKFGIRIPDIALKIQDAVKSAIEDMTGLIVKSVNIYVQGLQLNNDKQSEAILDNEST